MKCVLGALNIQLILLANLAIMLGMDIFTYAKQVYLSGRE
jgi:hypothetical protein